MSTRPRPTWLVKDIRGLLSPFLALLYSKSLATGCFPSVFMHAVVRSLLKKAELDELHVVYFFFCFFWWVGNLIDLDLSGCQLF